MTRAPFPLLRCGRLLALAAALLCVQAARADEYADVARLLRAGQHAEARAQAERYLAGKPKDPQMRFLLGVIQSESGQAAEALSTFTRMTEDYPELPEPYNNLAVLHAGQGQLDKARAALEMAVRANPGYAVAHENLGDVYARLAAQAYARALQLDAGNAPLQAKLALVRQLPAPPARPGAKAP